jgi:hypothetical protein
MSTYNNFHHHTITRNLLSEFIEDAKSKDDINMEFEIEYFYPNAVLKKINSSGIAYLNRPSNGSILIIEETTKNKYVIFPDNDKINFSKYDISELDELCFLSVENSQRNEKKYIGILHSITFGLNHGVTISLDSNGTDWTGYLGG